MNTRLLVALTMATLLAATSSAAGRAQGPARAGTIAFIRLPSETASVGQLFVVRPDGSGLRSVTPPSPSVRAYAWSPNGKLIAYIDQQFSLWLVRPDGKGRRLLLPTSQLSSAALSWSPDGKKIVVASPGRNADASGHFCSHTTLYVVPIHHATPVSLHAWAFCEVAWSPRGDEIAYFKGGVNFVIRPNGTDRHRLAHNVGLQWSPDGGQLAGGYSGPGLAVSRADGMRFHVVTTKADTFYPVAWSPGGRTILYKRANPTGLSVIDVDGRHNRRVTSDAPLNIVSLAAVAPAFAWSPGGEEIVYDADRTGNGDGTLYVIGANGHGKVQLTSTSDIDVAPSWAP